MKLTLVNLSSSKPECELILRALPQWFGIEKALINYFKEIQKLPTIMAMMDNKYVGFLSFKQHNQYAAEIYVMGVDPSYHRCGIGRALVEETQAILHQQKLEYLQVKTLSPSHPDPFYAQTRAFYLAMGFRPLEEFKQLWRENLPCLLMIKHI